MSKSVTPRTVADVTAQAVSGAITISDLDVSSFWVLGTFAGTGQIEVSPDNVNWIAEGATFTVPVKRALPADAVFARLNVTAFTSGAFESQVTGRNNDLKG